VFCVHRCLPCFMQGLFRGNLIVWQFRKAEPLFLILMTCIVCWNLGKRNLFRFYRFGLNKWRLDLFRIMSLNFIIYGNFFPSILMLSISDIWFNFPGTQKKRLSRFGLSSIPSNIYNIMDMEISIISMKANFCVKCICLLLLAFFKWFMWLMTIYYSSRDEYVENESVNRL